MIVNLMDARWHRATSRGSFIPGPTARIRRADRRFLPATATAEDALLILADIIEDMLDEASGHRLSVSESDGAT